MFVKAIATAAKYTRAVHFISRSYQSTEVVPGAASFFFVNAEGWALTCRHVTDLLLAKARIHARYSEFKQELAAQQGRNPRRIRRDLEKKFQYSRETTVELLGRFMHCVEVDGELHFTVIPSPHDDMALVKLLNHKKLLCDQFPVFASDGANLQQGKSLCRLGFPFPEFHNYAYDEKADKISWTDAASDIAIQFPIDGMLTRRLVRDGKVWGFEMSTPGLRGQSGGPAFDQDGKVWGMQSATNHLDLDFDVDLEVRRMGSRKRVKDSAFLHVGHCIHVDVMKQFMRDNNVSFQEA